MSGPGSDGFTTAVADLDDALHRVGDPGERLGGEVEVAGGALRALVHDQHPDAAPGPVTSR